LAVALCILLPAMLANCGPGPTPLPLAVTTPTATPVPRPRVLLLSLGGAGDDLVDGYLAEGVMPNLAALADRGAQAEHLLAVDPASSLTAHASMASGAYPSQTNQVGDRFHLPETLLHAAADSATGTHVAAEPLWRTAMRHGLTTATLFWPGRAVEAPAPADLMVSSGAQELGSSLHVLTTTVAADWPGAPQSYSPPLESTLPIQASDGPLVVQLAVLAVDRTDDELENYDMVYLAERRAIGPEATELRLGEWVPFASPRLYGRGQIKLLSASPEEIELYRTAMWYNRARPAELLREINEQFGFCPPPPDDEALEEGWVTAEEYCQMARRQIQWFSEVIAYVLDQHHPDLTMAWLGVVEQVGRHLLMAEELQPVGEPETVARYSELVEQAFALADETVGDLLGHMVLGKDTVFVVSDHGLAPVHTEVHLNVLLGDAGLVELTKSEPPSLAVNDSQAFAITSGGAAHIYVNLEGREAGGIVRWDEYSAVREEVVSVLQSVAGPGGEPVFRRVLLRDDLGSLGLDSFAAGDVFAQATAGYALSEALDASDALGQPRLQAAAGYDAGQRSMHAILVATGFGIRQGVRLPALRSVDIAPTVAHLLRIQPASNVDGHVVGEMLRGGP
jgi:predicted AlkP superfamily phosphohydrolase/phosphomutase